MLALWQEVSLHRHGKGLEYGCDFTVIRHHYNSLIRKGESAKAGIIMCMASGGLWPQARGLEAGLITEEENVCPVFHQSGNDEYRTIWDCIAINDRDPRIAKSNFLSSGAYMRDIS